MAVGFSDTPPSSASTFKSRYRALPVHTLGYYLVLVQSFCILFLRFFLSSNSKQIRIGYCSGYSPFHKNALSKRAPLLSSCEEFAVHIHVAGLDGREDWEVP